MNNKWKLVTLMILALVIGIGIGALLNRALIQRHIRHIIQMRAAGLLSPGDRMLLKSAPPEQQKRIREILDRHRKRLGEIHSRFGREIQDSFRTLKKEIDPILTPEQKHQLERMFPPPPFPDLSGDEMRFRRPGPAPFMRIERLKDELLLSDEQVSKMEIVLKAFRDRSESLNKNGRSPEDFQEMMKAREEMEAEIEKILTAEQKEKFSHFKRMRPPPGDR